MAGKRDLGAINLKWSEGKENGRDAPGRVGEARGMMPVGRGRLASHCRMNEKVLKEGGDIDTSGSANSMKKIGEKARGKFRESTSSIGLESHRFDAGHR